MHLFLTHVDTPFRMYRELLSPDDIRLMLSAGDTDYFDSLHAIHAFWCDYRLDDEAGWRENRHMRVYVKGKIASRGVPLSIEDARILGDAPLTRLSELRDDGIRIITPMWRGINRLGGAYDTESGLTRYGRNALCAAMEQGFLIDVSHASEQSCGEILALAKGYRAPVIATHSNFRTVANHRRNLTDRTACAIAESGGFIGLSLVPSHVGMTEDVPALLAHIRYGWDMGLSNHLCLGTDLDGTDALISPLKRAKDLLRIADAMKQEGYHEIETEMLFSVNATRFFSGRDPHFQIP